MTRESRRAAMPLLRRVVVVAMLFAVAARAQEFSEAAPAGHLSAAALLERGLPARAEALSGAAIATRWHGLAEIETRALAAAIGVRALRIAVGASQTGETDLGWSQVALGVGGASDRGGAALRGSARRRLLAAGDDGIGGEVGAGAWVAASPDLVVWASAPQLWTRGDPPPLERWLEIGARFERPEAQLWLSRAASPGAPHGLRAEHLGGLLLPAGPAAVWIEGRDHPARGTLGLAVAAGRLRVSAAVEGHPVLGETVRMELAWGERPWW